MIKVLRSSLVLPKNDTPKQNIWLSTIDLYQLRLHTPSVMFYKHNGDRSFFDTEVVKDGLRNALVPFYPLAGRLGKDENERTEIVCNAMGALFVEAEAELTLEEFSDYIPSLENRRLFVPTVNLKDGDEAIPLLLIQVTLFKCGSICIGTGIHHFISDGVANWHFINTWSYFTSSSLLLPLEIPPFLDRSLLRPRPSPTIRFAHFDYKTATTAVDNNNINKQLATNAILKLTRHQVSILKSHIGASKDNTSTRHTTYEAIAAHIWKCACKARNLDSNTESRAFIIVDARNRLRPSLPQGYFGNAVFGMDVTEKVSTVIAKPLSYIARKIQQTIARADDEYIRSTIDFLAMQETLPSVKKGGSSTPNSNISIISWTRLPLYDTNFGWGAPTFVGPASSFPGLCFVLPSPDNDGGIWIAISFEAECMERFKELFFVN